MKAETINHAVVVGVGTMGQGIVQVMAQVGIEVTVVDITREHAQKGVSVLQENLNRRVAQGKMTAHQAQAILQHVHVADGFPACGQAQVAIEAVVEDRNIKRDVFRQLDNVCPPDTVLLTNTSTLSPTDLASMTRRPQAVAGFHFMNPVPVMKLVEIVTGLDTAPETVTFARELAQRMGKVPVVAREHPGGIVSRIMIAMRNEAIRIYAEGIASAQDIDQAMMLGGNWPMGPLALTDLVGVDIHLHNAESLSRDLGPCYMPPPLVKTMVRAGKLGRKTGEGFFKY